VLPVFTWWTASMIEELGQTATFGVRLRTIAAGQHSVADSFRSGDGLAAQSGR
jgi:hypothetical protein